MHFGNMNWVGPLALLCLLAAGASLWGFFRDRRDLGLLGHHNLVLSPRAAWARRGLRALLLLLALTAAAWGAARPQGKLIPEALTSRGSDIMVVLDLSKSMDAQDLKPSRLGAAKRELDSWFSGLEGDRVGLVVFAGEAELQVPLTLDLDTLSQILDKSDTDTVGTGGTDIGEGIRRALSALPQDSKRGQAILLLSDGERTKGSSDIEEACREARARHVPIVTVGLGTPEGRPVPDGFFFNEPLYKKDAEGNTHISRLDEGTLSRIAQETGGGYLKGDSLEGLSGLDRVMSGLAQSDLTEKNAVRREELSPLAGLGAAGALLLYCVL